MKAVFAKVIGHKVVAMLKSGERIEIERSFDPEERPSYDYGKIKEDHGELIGVGTERIYDTPSGKLEPGCLFWSDWLPEDMYWDNHTGPQLHAVLPNGQQWNIDSRASNCTMPNDRSHRCWCRHGEIPNISVDKNGQTCSAGAGSIAVPGWHGFLTNGEFKEC
ncbi:MAG: hypothetical protein WCK18_19785 [Prolixibacteraceae bacterium]